VRGGSFSGGAYASPELLLAAGETRQRPEEDRLTFRDPTACRTTNLSNAVEITYQP